MEEKKAPMNHDVLLEIAKSIPGSLFQCEYNKADGFSITYACPEFWNIFQMNSQPLPYFPDSDFFDMILEEDLTALYQSMTKSMEDQDLWSLDFRIQYPTKEVRWVHAWAKASDQNKNDFCWNGYIKDITDDKMQRLSLMEDQKRWRFSLEEAGAGFWEWDIKNETIYRSAQTLRMIGFEEGELASNTQSWFERIHPEDRPDCPDCDIPYHELKRCAICPDGWFDSTNTIEMTYRIRKKDGAYLWVLDRGKVVERNPDETPRLFFGYIIDITSQKNLEESLKAERALFEHGPTSIIRIKNKEEWPIVYSSKNISNLIGYSSSELTLQEKPFLDLIHPDDQARVLREAKDIERTNKVSQNFIYRLINDQREPVWVSVVSKKDTRFEDSEDHFIGYINDFTYIMQSKRQMKTVMNAVKTLILVIDPSDDAILFSNEAAHQIYGKLEGKKSIDHFWSYHQFSTSGKKYPSEELDEMDFVTFHPESTKWYETSVATIEWINGKYVHLVIQNDVTELIEALDSLKQSEEEKESLLRAIPDNIFILNTQGKCLKSFIRSSESTKKKDWIIQERPLEDCFSNAVAKELLAACQQAIQTNEIIFLEYELTIDHKTKQFEARFLRLNQDTILMIERDMTNIKELQQITENALNVAQDSVQVKSQFLANMSHEIRTPMNGIIGYVDLLYETSLSKSQEKYVQGINAGIETLMHTINSVLDLSRIESGQLDLEKVPFNPLEEVAYIVESFLPYAEKNNNQITFTHKIPSSLHATLLGDAYRLRQVLNNLISNALKFTSKGSITVSLDMVPIDNQKVKLTVSITDTGIGIPSHQINNLFQPFMQVDSSTTRKYGGSGLGLPIAKQIVELMGGHMTVESEPLKGSCFRVVLPLETETPLSDQLSINHQLSIHKTKEPMDTILIIETKQNRSLFQRLLLKQQVLCDFSVHLQEAIEWIEQKNYSAIFIENQCLNDEWLGQISQNHPELPLFLLLDDTKKSPSLFQHIPQIPLPLTANKVLQELEKTGNTKED
ncbi:PAS domain-containing protein [Tindallia californiensis]|uniref:Circadian input-output histidine kinase CikA n=1 Tax=Tindallia californiensis TaxID=159292 RepID=A0A1H3PV11_9FIRM|nr:PAS domain-containing protein [Tindallia californiensis]SDZ04820.1 PAS domain S-box-containing protein [Tindallia californiensis]